MVELPERLNAASVFVDQHLENGLAAKMALLCGDRAITYRELHGRVCRFANALKALGAKLILTDGSKGMPACIAKAEEIAASDPSRYVLLQQFKNPANPAIHEQTTGPEIWKDSNGERQEATEWHNIVAWARLAEICNQYLHKGRQVYIEGRIQTRLGHQIVEGEHAFFSQDAQDELSGPVIP